MKTLLTLMTLVAVFTACNSTTKENEMKNNSKQENNKTSSNDTTPRVTGIGGVFFLSDNPISTTKWYEANLGLVMDEYGSAFEFRNANRPDEINYLRWSIGNEKEYFAPSTKGFMINYRVHNIEGLVDNLIKKGNTVLDSIKSFPYGKFVHILDPEGNKIELWEPIDSVLTEMGGKTTK